MGRIRTWLLIGAAVSLVLIASVTVLYLITKDRGGGEEEVPVTNKFPEADAGHDQVISPGEDVVLNASLSTDPDGDDLTFKWDTDSGNDMDGDGIKDNDWELFGEIVSYNYGFPSETITYIVTLNVSDGKLHDTSSVKITILVENDEEPPVITMSCTYGSPPGGLPIDPHYIISIDSTTSNENYLNFTYRLDDPQGNLIQEGTVQEIALWNMTDLIRYVDRNPLGQVSMGDLVLIREEENIVEGCRFYLFYLYGVEPVGEVELTKGG